MTGAVRIPVRVKPGSSSPAVGGSWDGDVRRLVVAVAARAIDGQANAAVVEAIASALGVRKGNVRIAVGHTNRSKLIEVLDPPAGIGLRVRELLDA